MNFVNIDFKRVFATLLAVAIAGFLAWQLWVYYMRSPWTRDGRVRAEVVEVAAQISGQITDIKVQDNQFVHKGDVLFVIDQQDYQLALNGAEATLENRRLACQISQENAKRRSALGAGVVAAEEIESYQNAYDAAAAAYRQAEAARDVAQLNLKRTTIYSPVNGHVTNLHLRVGDYAVAGQPRLSIIDSDSFWVAGYFEETKLPEIHEGDFAHVKLMGVSPEIAGHVDSFASGIVDLNGGQTTGLANVDPVFTWVRLAQRIPVRIAIDHVPDGVRIAAGQTCTIVVDPHEKK